MQDIYFVSNCCGCETVLQYYVKAEICPRCECHCAYEERNRLIIYEGNEEEEDSTIYVDSLVGKTPVIGAGEG